MSRRERCLDSYCYSVIILYLGQHGTGVTNSLLYHRPARPPTPSPTGEIRVGAGKEIKTPTPAASARLHADVSRRSPHVLALLWAVLAEGRGVKLDLLKPPLALSRG